MVLEKVKYNPKGYSLYIFSSLCTSRTNFKNVFFIVGSIKGISYENFPRDFFMIKIYLLKNRKNGIKGFVHFLKLDVRMCFEISSECKWAQH